MEGFGGCGLGDALPLSSNVGNVMPPARLRKALANDDVRRRVLLTPEEMVPDTLPIVSLRVRLGLEDIGEGGGCVVFCEPPDGTRSLSRRFIVASSEFGGGLSRDVVSNFVKGDSKSRATM